MLEEYAYTGGAVGDVMDANMPEDELEKLARMGLTPLAWLGQTLDKPGRAVRGLLDGRPGELLNLLPLSDTFGWTDPSKSVSGSDLLQHYGLTDEDSFWGGLAVETLLDPINYLTLGTTSTLTTLGREAAKKGTMAATAAERIAAKQSGLVGLRTPWYTDMLGLGEGRFPLLTGEKGEYLAGQFLTDLRSGVERLPGGKTVTGALDKTRAIGQTLFTPGAGYSMDPRITNTSIRMAEETTDAVKAASLEKRMAITEQARQAHEYLAGHGVPPELAEDAIGRAVTLAAEGVDPSLYQAKNVLTPFLESKGLPVEEISKGLDELVKPLAQNRDVFDVLRDQMVAAGVEVKENRNPWGLKYLFDQSQESMGGAGASTKARKIPDMPGGKTEFNDLVNDPSIAGIATAPIPDGVSVAERTKMVDKAKEAKRQELYDRWVRARDKKFPAEVPVATPVPDAPGAAAGARPTAEAVAEAATEVATDATKQFEKTIADLIGQRDYLSAQRDLAEAEGARAKVLDRMDRQIEKIERSIDKASADLFDLESTYKGTAPGGMKRYGSDILENALEGTNVGSIGNVPENSTGSLFRLQEIAEIKAEKAAARAAKAEKAAVAEPIPTPAATPPPAEVNPPVYPAGLSDEQLWKNAGETVNILADLDQSKVQAARGFYRGDILGASQQYTRNAAALASRGKSGLAVFAEQAIDPSTSAAFKENPRDFIRLDKALKKAGLKGNELDVSEAGKFLTAGGKMTLIDMLADEGKTVLRSEGKPLPYGQVQKTLKGLYVPRDIVEKVTTDIQGLGYIKSTGARKFLEETTSAIKSWLTLPFIPFHVRNMLEGFTQQGLGGSFSKEAIGDAAMYIAGAVKDPVKKAELDRLYNLALNHDAAFRGQMGELLGSSVVGKDIKTVQPAVRQASPSVGGSIMEWAADYKPGAVAERGEKYFTLNPEKSAVIQQAAKVSQAGDDLQRFSHFISLSRQGYAPEVAAKMVRDAHLDYSRLTDFERDVMRNLVPFYSFSRRNLSRMAGQAGNPGPLASMIRAVDGGDDFVPGYLGQASIPIPGGDDGKQRYLSGFSLPFEDELLSSIVGTASGDWRQGFNKAMQTTNPLLKLGVVLGTGRDLYSGRRLDEVQPTGLASLFPGTSGNVISQLVSATPAARVANTINSAVGGKDQFQALKLLSGLRTTDVDTEMATQDAATAQVAKMLKQTGMVATSENLYPRQQYRDPENQPVRLQSLLELMSGLKERGREMRKERADDTFVPR